MYIFLYFTSHILLYIYLCSNLYWPPRMRGLSNTTARFFRIQDKTSILYWHTGIGCVWSWFREIIIFQISVDDISWTSVTHEKCCSVRNKFERCDIWEHRSCLMVCRWCLLRKYVNRATLKTAGNGIYRQIAFISLTFRLKEKESISRY